jgi:hypothetical protein
VFSSEVKTQLREEMRRELLTWFSSLVILCLLALSACESTFTAPEAGDYGPQKQEKQLKGKH